MLVAGVVMVEVNGNVEQINGVLADGRYSLYSTVVSLAGIWSGRAPNVRKMSETLLSIAWLVEAIYICKPLKHGRTPSRTGKRAVAHNFI